MDRQFVQSQSLFLVNLLYSVLSLLLSVSPSLPHSQCSVFFKRFPWCCWCNKAKCSCVLEFLSLPSWFCIGGWNVNKMRERLGIPMWCCAVYTTAGVLRAWNHEDFCHSSRDYSYLCVFVLDNTVCCQWYTKTQQKWA